jgi:HSP20 family protein
LLDCHFFIRLPFLRPKNMSPPDAMIVTSSHFRTCALALSGTKFVSLAYSLFDPKGRFIMPFLPTRIFRNADPFELAHRELDNMFGRVIGNRMFDADSVPSAYPVNVREDADHLVVEAELPGFKKEEIDVSMENQTLTITAEHKDQHEEKDHNDKGGDWLLRERRYSRYQRSFTLPPTVDSQTVDAKLNDGVLTITLAKRAETKPRRISVS